MHAEADTSEYNDIPPNQPLLQEEKSYYDECKQYYNLTRSPLISISDQVFNDDIELTSLSIKFGIDEDYDKFNAQEFLDRICNIFNINRNVIQIVKLQSGSVILEIAINGKKTNIKMTLRKMYDSLNEELRKELAKLKVFFMYMGNIQALNDKQQFRKEVKLHPRYNRIYGKGYTYWTGALNDGRDRGPHPHYCPAGWKRYALDVTDNYREKFKGWSVCYHGTKFEYGLSILLSGLKPARCIAHGAGLYASPSIIYTSHPRYAEIKEINPSDQTSFFKNGKYVQFVLYCRVHPDSVWKIGCETLGIGKTTTIDPDISNDEIEWVINTEDKDILDFNDPKSPIVCTGIMIRVTDNHPALLPESQWYKRSFFDINHTDKCNIIYE